MRYNESSDIKKFMYVKHKNNYFAKDHCIQQQQQKAYSLGMKATAKNSCKF